MGIYRLSNRVVSGAQASCRLSAKGARSALAWGIRPREMITAATSAESAVQLEGFVKSLGLAAEPTRISAQFGPGASKRINAARLDDFNIGAFKMPPEKFGVAPLPQFALQQGSSKIAGILGMDTLYTCHAIIDLDGMGLFLK
jgi:hypothetical protein